MLKGGTPTRMHLLMDDSDNGRPYRNAQSPNNYLGGNTSMHT